MINCEIGLPLFQTRKAVVSRAARSLAARASDGHEVLSTLISHSSMAIRSHAASTSILDWA